MRTESQMLELVRTKVGRRRRRRRTAAASAGGGVAAVVLVAVVAIGGAGQDGAVEDIKTGPGASTTTTVVDGDVGGPDEDAPTTTSPPGQGPDAGAGASGTGSPGGSGPGGGASDGGPTTTAPGSGPDQDPDDPTLGTASGEDTGGGAPPPTTGPTTTTTTTTTTPPEPWVHDQTVGSRDGLHVNVHIISDPARPGVAQVAVWLIDTVGTAVYDGRRYGPSVSFSSAPGGRSEMGDPLSACDASAPYTTENGNIEDFHYLTLPSGWTSVELSATSLWCHEGQAEHVSMTFDVFVY